MFATSSSGATKLATPRHQLEPGAARVLDRGEPSVRGVLGWAGDFPAEAVLHLFSMVPGPGLHALGAD
jgi:hypothetical protein